jgi:2,4-diaminopentanoate dehydrogenase
MCRRPVRLGEAHAAVTPTRLRTVLVGFGVVNRSVLELALTRPWVEIAGIVVKRAEREGEPAQKSVPGAPADLRCSTDIAGTLRASRPDVCVVATRTKLGDVLSQLEATAAARVPTICTAEELGYVRPSDSPEAARIHELARENAVPIVASGVNPGFVLDLLPATVTRAAWDVERLHARRVVDVSPFGAVVRRSLGIDYEPDAFRKGVRDGSIMGHAGFRESLRVIADALGRELDRVEVVTEPRVAASPLRLRDGSEIAKGRTVGADQRAIGWIGTTPWLEVSMTIHVDPASEGLTSLDEIKIDGRHSLSLRSEPGFRAILTTAAVLVNALPAVASAAPGVYSSFDLGPIGAWLGAELPKRPHQMR